MNYKLKSFLLALLSAVLFWLAWPPHALGWLSFLGFVPLLIIQDFRSNKEITAWFFRLIIFFALLIWNIFTTWWVWRATAVGSITAFILNSFMMAIVWWVFDAYSSKAKPRWSYVFFVSFWLAYELFHLSWDGTWPWLILGNVFANNTGIIQWYEFTGHLGGSAWVLIVNVLVFFCWKSLNSSQRFNKNIIAVSSVILIPVLCSYILLFFRGQPENLSDKLNQQNNTIIVQPNLDPYTEKFNSEGNAISPTKQLERMLEMAEEKVTGKTEFVILPETALLGGMKVSELNNGEMLIIMIQEFVRRHPNCCVITGAETYTSYVTKETESARQLEPGGKYYDFFNTALKIDTSKKIEIYFKSKLVPGVEKLPYPKFFGPLARLLNLEAQTGGLGSQKEVSVFNQHDFIVAPLICYESVFGGYVQQFLKKDVNAFVVITNDGWWGNSDGYKQHLEYGKLRCIEFRKELVQCANTGLSAIINTNGEIIKQSEWWKQQVLETRFEPKYGLTIYARLGDFIGWLAIFVSLFLFIGIVLFRKLFREPPTD